MCTPNQLFTSHFPNNKCPDDNMPHFSIGFVSDKNNKSFIITKLPKSEKAYEANVYFTYDEEGNVKCIDVALIAPMPDNDPDEPIPYEVTELGKEWLEGHPENEREEARIKALYGIK